MYESPITVFEREFENHIEDVFYKAIKGFAVDVNKEELLKALQYDRGNMIRDMRTDMQRQSRMFLKSCIMQKRILPIGKNMVCIIGLDS